VYQYFQSSWCTSLGHQEGRRVFWEGPKIFEVCPIILIDVQYIFLGAWPPCAPLVTGLVCLKLAGKWNIFSTQNWQNTVYRTYLSRLILVVFFTISALTMKKWVKRQQSQVQTIQRTVNSRNVTQAHGASGVRRKFSWGVSFSDIWWWFVFGVRSLWRHNLTSFPCFQTNVLWKLLT